MSYDIEAIASGIYYMNCELLPVDRFPLSWEDTGEEIRQWLRARVRREFFLLDEITEKSSPYSEEYLLRALRNNHLFESYARPRASVEPR